MKARNDLYKATHTDGFDFATGTVRYEVGKLVRPKRLPIGDYRFICGPGYLHVANTPSETLVGGSWPCRLFRVESKPVVGFDEQHPHKAGLLQLRVLEELPAWQALGPNGEAVVALIERAEFITSDEAERLSTTWNVAWDAAWDATWSAAWDAARNATWGAAGDAAGDAAWEATWYATRDAARDAARNAARSAARDAARDAARGAAWEAAKNAARSAARDAAWNAAWDAVSFATGDAANALVVRDLIPTEQFDLLYGPWASVMGAA